jgi:hypothetical protein
VTEEEEAAGVSRTCLQFPKIQGPLGKIRFPTATQVKLENAQNKSCRVFQTLQHFFRA